MYVNEYGNLHVSNQSDVCTSVSNIQCHTTDCQFSNNKSYVY